MNAITFDPAVPRHLTMMRYVECNPERPDEGHEIANYRRWLTKGVKSFMTSKTRLEEIVAPARGRAKLDEDPDVDEGEELVLKACDELLSKLESGNG